MELLKNHRREKFCQEFVANQENSTQAYLSAFPNSSSAAARTSASRLLKTPNIKARISKIKAEKEPDLPLAELVARSLSQSLVAKKVIRIKGGYIEVPHHAVRLRAARMVAKFKGILK